ncbi:bifunctional riboflavin kinase/FAD synthetase [Flavobacterium sp. CYK-55]|uniref:bifunctional riboflavin kinase/FAD synthetase n=1 Tax=Flavobacterium sp. CYK-55 TaxID=2835529 RepID=UPI001BCBC3F2|nr:bifunctional riboflavin kinase/FAD synthetase [Flavobacterium sp. CYK-55]MBS7787814.1 bifunctional riboflavin kinase/FAD synthetase [Flavobacterium sp. CYK-55]
MNIFHSIDSFSCHQKTVVTIGTFDGVHIGHQKIVQQLLSSAQQSHCASVILTFFPHPRMVLQDQSEIRLLNTIEERTLLLEKTGLDYLIIHPFDHSFSRLTAEEFVKKVLVEKLNIQKIVIGYDHRFGRNRTADINDLIDFGHQYGFEVEQISAQQIEDVSVSSTKIRTALQEGQITLANQYLGYPYLLSGTVKKGRQLGRTIGFPTANIELGIDYKLIPKIGVYIVQSHINGKLTYGMMNIGTNPTVSGQNLSIEVYFIDFEADLYEQKLDISVLERIRDEEKFESLDALTKAISRDLDITRNYLKNR